MRLFFFFTVCLAMFYSCSLSTSERTNATKKDYVENLRVFLSKNFKNLNPKTEVQQIQLANIDWINKFYKEIKHRPIWIDDSLELNKNGEDFLSLLSSCYNYGLDTLNYHAASLKKIANSLHRTADKDSRYDLAANLEILLTNSYFLIGKDLNYGVVPKDSAQLVSVLPRKEFTLDLPKHLKSAIKTDRITPLLLTVQPKHQEYKKLQSEFEKHLKTASLSKENIKVEHFRLDSVKAYEQSKQALILHNYLTENSTDSAYFTALKKFQIQHGLKPDGLIGRHTARALSKSPYSDYKKAVVSLEKWRWKNNWDSSYIYVNIPSCEMKIYRNNAIIKTLNVVVGKPDTHTPEIDDEMEYMIVYPFWNLPYSISSKELLPKIKEDSTYLARNGYQVFSSKHKPLNSNEINWNSVTEENFNYKIRQNGGGSNSLGLIKFIFPNEHSIYFHDTPSKRFFANDIRAYSHGCVRVQHPLDLAETILASDNNECNIDSVKSYIDSKTQKRITLKTKIPVHIQYFTCGTDTNNNLVFYKDIYGLDDKIEELMGLDHSSSPANTPSLVKK